MRYMPWFLVAVVAAAPCAHAASISVPWEEFKVLYRRSIEEEMMKKSPKEARAAIHAVEDASYQVSVHGDRAEGSILITGRVLSGEPVPIPLFRGGLVIEQIGHVKGGSLLTGDSDEGSVLLLPDGGEPFQLEIAFLVPVQEDRESRFISFGIPRSLRNSLSLTLPGGVSVLEAPGISNGDGIRHFPASRSLTVRFAADRDIPRARILETDIFSRIRLQGQLATVSSHFLPLEPPSSPFTVKLSPGARYLSSSLKGSWMKKLGGNDYQVSLPAGMNGGFSIQFVVERSEEGGGFSLVLPVIPGNSGKEGSFILEEPDGAEVSVSASGLVSQVPVQNLDPWLRTFAGDERFYYRTPRGETLQVMVKHLDTVEAPAIVLDALYFFTSFEENGGVLSVLKMEVPEGGVSQLSMMSIPGAQVWSLTVNGKKRKVYTHGDGRWIVPLAGAGTSQVELAFLRKGDRLGLHGRLEALLPQTGVPARNIYIGLGLPERVELVSVEGPVSATGGASWKLPREFIGKPYFFSSAFYKGEGMRVALFYKEPVDIGVGPR